MWLYAYLNIAHWNVEEVVVGDVCPKKVETDDVDHDEEDEDDVDNNLVELRVEIA